MDTSCRICAAPQDRKIGFCSRCGARREYDPLEDAAARLQKCTRMIRCGVWQYDNCHAAFKKQFDTIRSLSAINTGSSLDNACDWLIGELQAQFGAKDLGKWVKFLTICLELSQIDSPQSPASIVGDWGSVRGELQRCKQLHQGILGLQKTVSEQSLSRSKLIKPLTAIAEQSTFTVGHVEQCIRQTFQAWPHLAVALELVTQDVAARESSVTKAQGQIKQENYGDARQLLEGVLNKDPLNRRALEALAGLHSRAGRKAEAIPLLRRALRVGLANPLTMNNFAWFLATEGSADRLPEAIAAARLASDVLPTATCFDTLAECYEKSDDLVAAFDAVRQGIEDDPDHEMLQTRLARLQEAWTLRYPVTMSNSAVDEDSFLDDEGVDFSLALDAGDLDFEDSGVIALEAEDDSMPSGDLEVFDEEMAPSSVPSPSGPSSSRSEARSEADLEFWQSAFGVESPAPDLATSRGDYSTLLTPPGQPPRDPVDCSVFAPPQAFIGDSMMVQVFVHQPEQAEQVMRAALEFDDEAQRRGATSLGTQIARGSTLTFELLMPGLKTDEPDQHCVWQGRPESVQFAVEIPAGMAPRTVIGTVIVSQNSVPIGTIKFKLKLMANQQAGSTPQPMEKVGTATRFRKAFVSYASDDRPEVLRRVQMLAAVGIQFFQDVLNLDPGQRWEQELYRHIDDSDVMFLFWSNRAKESPWVAREWQYAREKKGEDFIRPVIIEGPPIVPPPSELSHLHFNDRVLYFLKN